MNLYAWNCECFSEQPICWRETSCLQKKGFYTQNFSASVTDLPVPKGTLCGNAEVILLGQCCQKPELLLLKTLVNARQFAANRG
jgi:hypothetical protein